MNIGFLWPVFRFGSGRRAGGGSYHDGIDYGAPDGSIAFTPEEADGERDRKRDQLMRSARKEINRELANGSDKSAWWYVTSYEAVIPALVAEYEAAGWNVAREPNGGRRLIFTRKGGT